MMPSKMGWSSIRPKSLWPRHSPCQPPRLKIVQRKMQKLALAASSEKAGGDDEESIDEEGESWAIEVIDVTTDDAEGGAHAGFHRSRTRWRWRTSAGFLQTGGEQHNSILTNNFVIKLFY